RAAPLERGARGRAGELEGAAVRRTRRADMAALGFELADRGGEHGVVLETIIADEALERAQAGPRTARPPDGDRALQGDDRRRREREQLVVERDDLRPIGCRVGHRERVARRDRGLEMKRRYDDS